MDIVDIMRVDIAVKQRTLHVVHKTAVKAIKVNSSEDDDVVTNAEMRKYVQMDLLGSYILTTEGEQLLKLYAGVSDIDDAIAHITVLKRTIIKPQSRVALAKLYSHELNEELFERRDPKKVHRWTELPRTMYDYFRAIKVPEYWSDLTRREVNYLRSIKVETLDNRRRAVGYHYDPLGEVFQDPLTTYKELVKEENDAASR